MAEIPKLEKRLRLLIAVLAFPLTWLQIVFTQLEKHKYKPPGRLIARGRSCLHAQVTGQGTPTVILEAGMGGSSLDWTFVQPEVGKEAKVVSYDRSGMGWSGAALEPATCSSYVRVLRELLMDLNCKPPYVLAGHSYGGMIMRLFAAEYPGEVQGLLLVDTTTVNFYLLEGMSDSRKQQREINRRQARLGYLLSPVGVPRMLKKQLGSRRLPEPVRSAASAIGYRSYAYKTLYAELLASDKSARELQAAPPLRKDLPVIVLSAGQRDEEWRQSQEQLANLTAQTRHIMAADSPHSIQIHRPELVIAAIKELLVAEDTSYRL